MNIQCSYCVSSLLMSSFNLHQRSQIQRYPTLRCRTVSAALCLASHWYGWPSTRTFSHRWTCTEHWQRCWPRSKNFSVVGSFWYIFISKFQHLRIIFHPPFCYLWHSLTFGHHLISNFDSWIAQSFQHVGWVQTDEIGDFISHWGRETEGVLNTHELAWHSRKRTCWE